MMALTHPSWLAKLRAICMLPAILVGVAAQAQQAMRIEAVDGGVVDLNGVAKIVGQGQEISIRAEGEGSRVELTSLEYLLNQDAAADTALEVTSGGTIALNPDRTRLDNNARLHLTQGSQVLVGTLELAGGAGLIGRGTLDGSLENGGLVAPGDAAGDIGFLVVTGNYLQSAIGELRAELKGEEPGTGFDQLRVGGTATLNGLLQAGVVNAYLPYAGSRFPFLLAGQRQDQFSAAQGLQVNESAMLGLAYGDNRVDLIAEGLGFLDSTGPTIEALTFDGQAIGEGFVATSAGELGVTASDPSGLARAEFFVDGQRIGEDADVWDGLSIPWDIAQVTDGVHDLAAVVYDVYENPASGQAQIQVDLAAPPVPTIEQPADGTATSISAITVTGGVAPGAQVLILRGDWQVAGPVAGTAGRYEVQVSLVEGENPLRAVASNRGGLSDPSATHRVFLDSTIPRAPQGLSAVGREQGEIRLAWGAVAGASGYNLYRAGAPFQTIAEAQKLNGGLIGVTGFNDLPASDGEYFYRVTAVNAAGTESPLSEQASAQSDSTPPAATAIGYTPLGAHDPSSGRFGVGQVFVTLDVSEPLLVAPFLSITPEQGTPQSVQLEMLTETRYQGEIQILETTASGTAHAVFSARDRVGNRGTEIAAGGSILIDTDGPAASLLVVPGDPIENDPDDPTQLQISLQLDGAPKAGTAPSLSYLLSGPGRVGQPIALSSSDGLSWVGTVTLPGDAGAEEVETLSFQYQAYDDLDNLGEELTAPSLQVYAGELPPLPVPTGLAARALPAGEVALEWIEVAGAAGYQVYRQAPGEAELTPHGELIPVTSLIDGTMQDGDYWYAVASVREANSRQALSAQSDPVTVTADSMPPLAPQALTLELVPQGVSAGWQAPDGEVPTRYGLYRSDQNPLLVVEGATLVRDDIPLLEALDSSPSADESTYVVTAFDAAGNESPPSDSAYLNIDLLPVASMLVVQEEDLPPTLSWTHTGSNIQGYNLYLGPEDDRLQLNAELLIDTSYNDTGYLGDERLYTVVPVDDHDMAGLGRSLLLPDLEAEPAADSRLLRGVMNELRYLVTNGPDSPASQIRLRVSTEGRDHVSAPFDLDSGETREITLVVGGYEDLPDTTDLESTLLLNPNPGEEVRIMRHHQVTVGDADLRAQVMTRSMTRGGVGEARFVLENTSDLELEIVTARSGGSAPSDEVRFLLGDPDGNVLSTKSFKLALGASAVTLPNGTTVLRIPSGGRFESDWVEVPVPSGAPDDAILELVIDRIHYHLGQDDAVSITGLSRRTAVALVEPEYECNLVSVAPQQSFGDQEVLIHGQAVDKATGELLALTALELVLSNQGFERSVDVRTNANGDFFYSYVPLANGSGSYKVSCIHPDLLERPEQGELVIGQAWLRPTRFALDIPRNAPFQIDFNAYVGSGVDLAGLRLAYVAEDQAAGELLPGILVDTGSPVEGTGGGRFTLSAIIEGDETAAESGSLVLRLLSDTSGDLVLDKVEVEYVLSPARPVLLVTPSHLHLGIAHGEQRVQTLTLENQGTLPLMGVSLALVTGEGQPAPSWISLLSPADQGDIPVGGRNEVRIAVSPDEQVPEDVYAFVLRIDAENDEPLNLNLFVSVNQSGVGNALFKLSDLYTATLDGNGDPIPGLQGATVRLQKQPNYDVETSLITDELGEAFFTDLPAGEYAFHASAPSHQFVRGRLKVEPGATTLQEVFLNYNLVTVEWEVSEITLLDRYQLVLHQTFETDVPAPVVVIEPMQVELPEMEPGDVLYGELQITNYGLVRADEVTLTKPPADQYFRYELLADVPDTLEAKQRVTIPYRVTSLRSLNPTADGDAGGGGSGKCANTGCANVSHNYICANGKKGSGSSRMCFTSYPPCVSSGPGGSFSFGPGVGGGGGSDIGGPWKPIDCDDCKPKPDCKVCTKVDCRKCVPDPKQNGSRCSDKPKEECFVCKDGNCGRSNEDCGASNSTESNKVSLVPPLLSTANGALETLLNLSPIFSVNLDVSASGEEKLGEECCKDCTVGPPVQYHDMTVAGEVKITASVHHPKIDKKRQLGAIRVKVEVGLGLEVGVEGSGGGAYKLHEVIPEGACNENKCEQAEITVGAGVFGQGFAVASGVVQRRVLSSWCVWGSVDKDDNKCWETLVGATLGGKAGIKGNITGKRVIGKEACEQEGCSVTATADVFGEVSGEIAFGFVKETVTIAISQSLGSLTLADCN